MFLPNDLRVLSCEFPYLWNGEPLRDPEAVKRNIQTKIAKLKPPKKPKPEKPDKPVKEKKMTDVSSSSESKGALTVVNTQTMTKAMSVASLTDQAEFLFRMGRMIAASKMFGCNNDAQGVVLAAACGGDMTKLVKLKQTYHIIHGNLTMRSDAMLAKFASKPKNTYRIISRTHDEAAIEFKVNKEAQIFRFTWAEAQIEDYVWTKGAVENKKLRVLPSGALNESLLKDNWSTPRRRMQMLWARVVSDGVRAVDATVNCGTYTADEMGGDAPEVTEEDIEDAEFTVNAVKSEVTNEDNAAAVSDAPESQTSEAGQPAAPTTEVASEVSGTAAEAESAPAVTYKSEPSPVAEPAPGANQKAVLDDQKAMLLELKALKDELLTDEQYKSVLANKYKVLSAKELELPVLAQLVSNLKARKARTERAAGKDELSQWAANAVSGAPAGN